MRSWVSWALIATAGLVVAALAWLIGYAAAADETEAIFSAPVLRAGHVGGLVISVVGLAGVAVVKLREPRVRTRGYKPSLRSQDCG
jgi:hypothetical protein